MRMASNLLNKWQEAAVKAVKPGEPGYRIKKIIRRRTDGAIQAGRHGNAHRTGRLKERRRVCNQGRDRGITADNIFNKRLKCRIKRGFTMKLTRTHKNFFIAVIIGFLIFFLAPPANGLTPAGVKMLSVFVPVVYIWLTEGGIGWSALFAVTMLVLLGAYNGALSYIKYMINKSQ